MWCMINYGDIPYIYEEGRVLESLIRMFALTLLIQRPLFIFELHRRRRKLDYEKSKMRRTRLASNERDKMHAALYIVVDLQAYNR